jgi:hypothetical protein
MTIHSRSSRGSVSFVAGVLGLGLSGGLLVLAACGSDDDGTSNFNGTGTSSGSSGSSGFQSSGDLPEAGPPPVCVAKEAEAAPGKRPVDIIIAIDNSVSMADEIAEVEAQINNNFSAIIEASGTDYRVIMLSNHGEHDVPGSPPPADPTRLQRICIKAPLSGTSCSPIPAVPAETAKFVHHNVIVNSQDAFCQIIQTFNGPDRDGNHPQGWAPFLRANAFKVFAVMTDDRVNTACNGFTFDDKNDDPISGTTAANTFDSVLFGLSPQFGNASRRNYVWHSIVALAPFDSNDLTKPHPPSAPIVVNQCSPGSEAPATGYQALSKLTGGLRYPTCGLNFTTIFQAMAQDVIDSSVLACDYAIPANPSGGTIDPATAVVRYTSGATVTDFEQIPNATTCAPDKFYIEGDRIRLCPDSCLKVQNDPVAAVKILFGCLPKNSPQK